MNRQMDFSGQTIWVTGAGQGIGRSVAEGFAQLGGQVIGFDLSFPEQNYGFTRYVLDIGDAQAVQQACHELLGAHGVIDVLASVAGVLRLAPIEALALVGGLNTSLADPTGVFIFRNEPAEIANTVLGRTDLVGAQRMVYVLDLTQPTGMFEARDFLVRDGDTVYVTEAPFVQWQKTLTAITGTSGAADTLATSATGG